MPCALVIALLLVSPLALGEQDTVVDATPLKGDLIGVVLSRSASAAATEFTLSATGRNVAAGDGLLLEGFGVGSYYVPNRRLNEKLEAVTNAGQSALRYTYDCDGPNIAGLTVTRVMDITPGETSLRVRWRVENKGKEEQWVAPWLREELAPAGRYDAQDRLEIPTLRGIVKAEREAYYVASRNWAAATSPVEKQTIYAVMDANQTYAFLSLNNPDKKYCGFQGVFVPRVMKPGDVWETVYRVNSVHGLSHVDFATDELAAQLDYKSGTLELLLAGARSLPMLDIHAGIRNAEGQVWPLPVKHFELTTKNVVRCSYEWTAPADGAYEFLGQLKKGNDPFLLSKETASPHGGIDTQFVVGAVPSAAVTMEAWTDAPHVLDRQGRTLQRTLASGGHADGTSAGTALGGAAVWFDSPLEKIGLDDVAVAAGAPDSVVRIALAGNEAESFQVVIRPPKESQQSEITVTVHDLAQADGGISAGGGVIASSNVRVSSVEYVRVDVPSYFEGPTGLWPDPLHPPSPPSKGDLAGVHSKGDLAGVHSKGDLGALVGGRSQPLWITVYAPEGTPPGRYTGTLDITSPGLDPLQLTIEAKVFDFTLPRIPALKTNFGFRLDDAFAWSRHLGFQGAKGDLDKLYLEDASRHRVALRPQASLPSESADYAASLKAFAPRLNELTKLGANAIAVPASLLETPAQLRLADAFVVQHGLEGRAFCQIANEPRPPAWPRLYERMQQWKDTAHNIALMATTFGTEPFLSAGLDIWTVHTPMLDTVNRQPILDRIKEGGEVWWYVNHSPPRPYGNFLLDFAGIEHRILFWQAWALGIKGFHYAGINLSDPGQDPRMSQLDVTPANGDGFLVYPGPNGPLDSIRWEIIRDGIEDYDYLALLRERIQKAQQAGRQDEALKKAIEAADIKGLTADLVSFPRDIKILASKRAAIAQAIEALGRAAR